ncbi:MAG: hypothetical protein JXX29_15835 [Deltaproteobacteria bacterium]|nr:hypothetical protein [Deltaproteobacteria bacterium]MBN2673152.1 hypothetical protein [Deltaproteobacteria bacterium]
MTQSASSQTSHIRFVVAIGMLFVLLMITTSVHASYIGTPYQGERPRLFELHMGLAYYDIGMASGGRFSIPLADNGFIQSINNAVYLSLGADFYLVRYHDEPHGALGIPIALHWEFYFSDKWSAYGEAGVNIFFHPSMFQGDGWTSSPGHWIAGSVGGRYHVNDVIALTVHVGNPYSALGFVIKF